MINPYPYGDIFRPWQTPSLHILTEQYYDHSHQLCDLDKSEYHLERSSPGTRYPLIINQIYSTKKDNN